VIAEAGTPLDVQRLAAEHGFDITLEEIAAALSARELSDAELETVSGGEPPCQYNQLQPSLSTT